LKYNSNLQFGTTHRVIEASFKLTKTMHCHDSKNVDEMVNKLDRLKNEDFNRVFIPNYEYKVNDNDVIYTVDFIKGFALGTLVPKYAHIVYEDVVQRKSEWTFMDLHTVNFIVDYHTEKIYAVDFQSYTKIPNQKDRQECWDICRKTDMDFLKGNDITINQN
tara:strand:- start:972 stop:1457 length:486 start_codon:yes stop_codon:yes gene_type:complete